MGDPIADMATYGYYAVMQEARRHGVRVLLQGQGADELFGTYGWLQSAARVAGESRAGDSMVQRLESVAPSGTDAWEAGVPAFYDQHPDHRDERAHLPGLYSRRFVENLEEQAPACPPVLAPLRSGSAVLAVEARLATPT